MRKKIDLSKEVLNNYEKTIERLHRQLEYFKVKHTIPEIGHLQRQMSQQSDRSQANQPGVFKTEDQNVVEKLLKDIEVLTETVRAQADDIAVVKFENEKLLNLYQNKENLLNDKRNELADAQASYQELLDEKNYIEEQNFNNIEDESLLYILVKIQQEDKSVLKQKLKELERNISDKNVRMYILEEKDQIWNREREFYILK